MVWTLTDAKNKKCEAIEDSLLMCLPCFGNPLALVLALKQTFESADKDPRRVKLAPNSPHFARQQNVGG